MRQVDIFRGVAKRPRGPALPEPLSPVIVTRFVGCSVARRPFTGSVWLATRRLQGGGFKDAEDVILQALQASPPRRSMTTPAKDIEELFAPLRGLDLDFSRNPSTGRPLEL
jgi:hypothetical protein